MIVYIYLCFGTLMFLLGHVSVADASSGGLRGHCKDGCIILDSNWACQSCKSGCYGTQCAQVCQRCDVEGCDRNSGKCHKCKPGYYGDGCDIHCPKGCMPNKNAYAACERSSGNCLEICGKWFHGKQCDKPCPNHCRHSMCNQHNGQCLFGCKKGWKGSHCTKSCQNCQHGLCHKNGLCKHGCRSGYYGHKCEKRCNCLGTGCDIQSGLCHQCQPGYYGARCDLKCNKNCKSSSEGLGHCHQHSGRCMKGCVDGTYGGHCNKTCNMNCKFSQCLSHDGFCSVGCRDGWTGFQCEKPTRCLWDLHKNGKCRYGCTIGWSGESCNVACPLNCKTCDHRTGKCLSCHEGYFGGACVQECSFSCNNTLCNMDGSCASGCIDGFYGNHCDRLCDMSCLACHQFSGRCTECIGGYSWSSEECTFTVDVDYSSLRNGNIEPLTGQAIHTVSSSGQGHLSGNIYQVLLKTGLVLLLSSTIDAVPTPLLSLL